MPAKTEKDLWIEMSIREIGTQAHFAELAYHNIDPKAASGNDALFSSIHSFLSHCTMVSKMLRADDKKTPDNAVFSSVYSFLLCCARAVKMRGANPALNLIGDILGVPATSLIHKRMFRNHLEHYDERLKKWIRKYGANSNVGTYNVGPKAMFKIPNMIYVSHYDPTNNTFTFVNRDFDLGTLYEEVRNVKGFADKWVQDMQQGKKVPPFG